MHPTIHVQPMKRTYPCSFFARISSVTHGILPALAALLLTNSLSVAEDISGEWEFAFIRLGDTNYVRVNLKSDGQKFSGNLNEIKLEGTTRDDKVSFKGARPDGEHFGDFAGILHNNTIEGTATLKVDGKITWSAKRAVSPPAVPKVHEFEPTEFHRVFSDAIPPVLHIFPGDTVRTWTVDAGGVDSKGVRRSRGGNPQTGPFYIEGAIPGDTLVVSLKRIRLNRDSAISGNRIVNSALSPGFVQGTKYDEKFDSEWILDREKGIGQLKKPSERLKKYQVKLQPMLGCVAVAPPAHQSFRTGYLGAYGGNMDYNQIREGTTLYLPVFAPGALLFVGDGHAAQGDGELTGDALETSMDVEFTVKLIKGESINNPRAENDEYLMALGIANSLPEAVQSATTGLATWLQQDRKLEPNEVAVVLGTAIQYNITEVVDPLVHVVAKIRKSALADIK